MANRIIPGWPKLLGSDRQTLVFAFDDGNGGPCTPVLLSPPTNTQPTQTTTGGSIAAGTWYFKVTYLSSFTGETNQPGAAKSVTTTGTASKITVPSPTKVTGASQYNVYASTSSSGTFYLQGTFSLGTSAALASLTLSGTTLPTTDTTPKVTTPSIAAITGNPSLVSTSLAWSATNSWIAYPLTAGALASDSPTWTSVDKWITLNSAANGLSQLGLTSAGSITNPASPVLVPAVTNGQATMKQGYDFSQITTFSTILFYSNVFKQQANWSGSTMPATISSQNLIAGTGGSIAAGTYYVLQTYLDAFGGETSNSNAAQSVTVAASGTITVPSPAAASGASQYKVYVGSSSGGLFYLQGGAVAIGSSVTLTSLTLSGTTLPTADTTFVLDSNQYPVRWVGANTAVLFNAQGVPSGYTNAPIDGIWKVMWDDPNGTTGNRQALGLAQITNCTVKALTGTITQNGSPVAASSYGNATDNYQYYQITRNTAAGTAPFGFGVNTVTLVQGSGTTAAFSNARCYPPDPANTANALTPTKTFHPNVYTMLAGADTIRWNAPMMIGFDNASAFTDWTTGSEFTYGNNSSGFGTKGIPSKTVTCNVSRIDPMDNPAVFDNSNGYFQTADFVLMVLTVDDASKLQTGHIVGLDNFPVLTSGSTQYNIVLNDGTLYNLNIRSGAIYKIDNTHIAIGTALNKSPSPTIPTGGIVVSGQVVMTVNPTPPLADMVQLCNDVGANFYILSPRLTTDACWQSVVTYCAQHLTRQLYHEHMDEIWNGLYLGQDYMYGQGVLLNAQTPSAFGGFSTAKAAIQYGVYQATHLHAIGRAAWTAAGRTATDYVRVIGGQFPNTGVTTTVLGQLNYQASNLGQGGIVDCFVTAPYIDATEEHQYTINLVGAPMDAYTLPGLHVLYQCKTYLDNYWGKKAQAQANAWKNQPCCSSSFFLAYYEGGPETGVNTGSTTSTTKDSVAAQRSRAFFRHPDLYHGYLYWLKTIQDGDDGSGKMPPVLGSLGGASKLFIRFELAQVPILQYNAFDAMWGDYHSWNMKAGPGDGSGGGNNNAASGNTVGVGSSYEDIDHLESVPAYTLQGWRSLLSPVPPATGYTITAPTQTSGAINAASGTYTITLAPAGLVLTTDAHFTLSDSLSGTFSPGTTVTIASGATSATFTLTPTVTGSHSITVGNDQGFTQPASLTYTVHGVRGIASPRTVASGRGRASGRGLASGRNTI